MESWFSLGISIFAFIISLLGYFHNKRTLVAEVISKQRIDWIHSVRIVVADFISLYLTENDKNIIIDKKYQIELYLNRNNSEHIHLINALNECVKNFSEKENKEKHIDKVVQESLILLNKSWRRMKIETGVTRKFEKQRDKKV